MAISTWSTTPANNTQAVPNGWPNTALVSDELSIGRQHMADIRTWYETAEWIDLGDVPTYISATVFTVPTDRTSFYLIGRRLKMYGSTMGTFYGSVISSIYDGVATTTITVDIDGGNVLTNNISQVWIGILSSQNSSIPPSVFQDRNILISGDFRTAPWQQGTSFNSGGIYPNNDGTYLVDNWILISDGNNVVNVSKDTDNSCKFIVNVVNKKFGFVQLIENAKMPPIIDDGQVSVIIEAKSSGIDNLRCAILAWTGTINAPTKDVVSAWGASGTNPTWVVGYTAENSATNLPLTSSYKEFRISNISVDTLNTNNLALVFWTDDTVTSVNDTVNVKRVKLQVSPNATQFEFISPADALFYAQTYYAKTFDQGTAPAVGAGSTGAITYYAEVAPTVFGADGRQWFFPATMIAIPSVTIWSPFSNPNGEWQTLSGATPTSGSSAYTSRATSSIVIGGPSRGIRYFVHVTADARIGV